MFIDKYIYRDTILKDIFKIKEKDYCGQIVWKIDYNWKKIWKIDDFSKMEDCEQNPKWHGEGNVKKHTLIVCEAAEKIVAEGYENDGWIYGEDKFNEAVVLLTAALFHDIGKIRTTKIGKDGNWHSYNHEYEGEKMTRRILWDTGYLFREKVCALVKYHMIPLSILDRKDYIEEIVKISKICSWKLLYYLKKCDLIGSVQKDENLKKADFIKLEEVYNIAKIFENVMDLPKNRGMFNYQKYLEGLNKKPLTLIMMIGLPGSGKDTYIKENFNTDRYSVICRDDIRVELGFCKENEKIVGTSKQEEEVTKVFNEKMLEAARNGKTIVINNINLKKEYRVAYTRFLSNYNVFVKYIYIEATSLSKNLERRDGQINESIFNTMIEKFEWPNIDEYDELFVVTN